MNIAIAHLSLVFFSFVTKDQRCRPCIHKLINVSTINYKILYGGAGHIDINGYWMNEYVKKPLIKAIKYDIIHSKSVDLNLYMKFLHVGLMQSTELYSYYQN